MGGARPTLEGTDRSGVPSLAWASSLALARHLDASPRSAIAGWVQGLRERDIIAHTPLPYPLFVCLGSLLSQVCKVEPFQRGLKTLNTDCMLNGRTRWQGFERAWIDQFENAPIGGGLAKCNPIAYWTFEDTFDYIAKYKVPYHPSCENGYPSHGDLKDTVPVPSMDPRAKKQEEGFTAFKNFEWVGDKTKWLDYATERVGRFVGLVNKDGSVKTECGIHVAGAEKTFDRDLWEGGKVQTLASQDEVTALKKSGKEAVVVVYAPWCQFCQGMEEEYEKFAADAGVPVYKFRGDEEREFVGAELNTKSFPTINFIAADGTATKYESEDRTVSALKGFASSKVAA
jgi:thiol-disulfide isomerase/thioredoxin